MNEINPKFIIASDPSYSAYGLTIIDRINKTIKTYNIQTTLGKQSFHNIAMKAKEQEMNVINTIKEAEPNKDILSSLDTVIGMENSLPDAFNSVSLTALDVLLYHEFGTIRTAVFNPTYLSFIMGKHTKKDSINLAIALMSIFVKHGYEHIIQAKKNLTDGEAESFIYACRMLCRTQPDDEITKEILNLQPLFAEEKEKYSEDFIW